MRLSRANIPLASEDRTHSQAIYPYPPYNLAPHFWPGFINLQHFCHSRWRNPVRLSKSGQSGADAGVKADLLVDGAAIGLEGAGMPLVGFTEHRPDQSVEQVDCLVRQAGGEIEGDGDQGGMPALALVTRDMLHRGAARFAGELGKAGLMHTMPARRIKAGGADMVQALDQTEHRDRLRRFPASGAARRASSGWFPLGAAS